MRKFYLYLSLLGSFFVLNACNIQHHLSDQRSSQSTVALSSYDSLPFQATPDKAWELIHTGIDISFDIPARTAEATTVLTLHPYFYPSDSISLDAKGMKILSVEYKGKYLVHVRYHREIAVGHYSSDEGELGSYAIEGNDTLAFQYTGTKLNVKLPVTCKRDDTVQLTIHYIAQPYAAENVGGKAITEERGLYFINADHFEPYQQMQIWTQGETEANSHWFPTFDHTNFRSTFTITMHVPDSFKTLSNGRMVASTPEAGSMRADTWEQDKPISPYLAMMAASNFAVVADRNTAAGKTVDYYVPQAYKDYALDIFKNSPEMVDFFSEKLKIDYPWDKYSQVIGYDYVSGAMENVSASLFGAFNLKDARQIADDNNDFIVAHELFHQWFGDYATCENWSQITLNESFADFSEKLWAEYKYGDDQAEIEFYN